MTASVTSDNLSRHELHTLQRALRKRASNLRKKGKRLGLIRPLSTEAVGEKKLIVTDSGALHLHSLVRADSDPVAFKSPVTAIRNGHILNSAPTCLFDPEVCLTRVTLDSAGSWSKRSTVVCLLVGLFLFCVEPPCCVPGEQHKLLTEVSGHGPIHGPMMDRVHQVVLQIVCLVFYLPVLSAYFDEPPRW